QYFRAGYPAAGPRGDSTSALEMLGAVRGVSSTAHPGTSAGVPLSRMQDERGFLIVPHELATGADCDGCLIVVEHGDMVEIKCNSCSAVVDTVPIDRAGHRLMELAGAEICSTHCLHCGALNAFRGFSMIEAFICKECGEGVNVARRVQ